MRMAYEVSGDGPPLVLLHGLTNSRRAWDPICPLLEDRFTCVRPDLRGHGETALADDYAMPSLVGDVHALVERLGLGPPALVGHSLGGTVAAVYAAAFPARAVMCVDQSLRFGDFARRIQPHADRLMGAGWAEALLDIERDLGVPVDDAFARRVRGFPPEVVRGIWGALLTTDPAELTALAEALLPRIAVPLLSLHGGNPEPGYAQWLTRLVPTARVEIWEGEGHMLHLADPQRFAARVRAFVD